jgi:predicted acyl esterase
MSMPFRATTLLVLAGVPLGASRAAAAADQARVETVTVTMPDGAKLATDVYHPGGDGPHPAVLMRTPYSAQQASWLGEGMAARGFVVVLQDVRGQGRSEGQFIPFLNERADGEATVDWIVEQPWSDGTVALWGVSYHGFVAYETAMTGHPAVRAVFVNSAYSDLARFMAHGGAFQLEAHLYWYYSYASGQPPPPAEAWPQIFRTVPLMDFFRGAEGVLDLAAAPYDHTQITAPVMHVTGWYDYIYRNVLETYADLRVPEQRLVIGPWSHNGTLNSWTKVGDVEFGEAAAAGTEWAMDLGAQWFRHVLGGEENELSASKPVRYFVMGDNRWIDDTSWPPSNAEFQQWYAHEDGSLSLAAPTVEGTTSFVYDPHDPVPTLGGANSHFFPDNLGPKDQTPLERRDDILVFTSAPLEEDVTVAGPITAVVYAATTGKDTDFTAKLSVVRADGFVRNLEDGIVRARYLFEGSDADGYVTPGEVYRYEIECGATAIALKTGERLQLAISSSNFPKYDRNPNTGIDPFLASEFVTATQTVHHSSAYPTHVVVPVIQ